jgi:uncharacterized protein YbcV (DUF1398 family)
MFTLQQISEAHSKVKSGTDFPQYIQDLIHLGLQQYHVFVSDGHAEYFGKDNYKIESSAKYELLSIANSSNVDLFKHYLQIHQQGETDYLTFCKHAAETGIEKWIVDTDKMTCAYFDKHGNELISEKIPTF